MMDEKNDLMQDLTQGNSNNMKKYLILGGVVFILFVVGIVIAKFAFSPSKQNSTQVILPPTSTQIAQNNKKQNDLFSSLPVENEAKNQNSISEKKQQTNQTEQTIQKINSSSSLANTNQNSLEAQAKKQKAKSNNQIAQVEEQTIPVQKPKITKTKKSLSSKKPATKKEIKSANIKTSKNGNYYIQVAALTRDNPSKKFLELITKNGFKYKIVQAYVNGIKVKRVLIGGYKTYNDAKKVLPKVQANITSSAFVKRLK